MIKVGKDIRNIGRVYFGNILIRRMYHMGRLVFNLERIKAILFGDPIADDREFVPNLEIDAQSTVNESSFHFEADDPILEGNHGAVFALAGTTATNSANEASPYPTIRYNAGEIQSIPVGPALNTKDVLLTSSGGIARLNADGTTEIIINPAQGSLQPIKVMETEDKVITYNTRFLFIAPYITIWDKTTSTADGTATVPLPAGAAVLGIDNFGGLIGVVHTAGIIMYSSTGTRAEASDVTATFPEGDTQAGAGAVFNSGANAISPVLAITDYLGNNLFRNDTFFSGHPIDIAAFSRDGTIIYGIDPDAMPRKVTVSWAGDARTNRIVETYLPEGAWVQENGKVLLYSKKESTIDNVVRREFRFYEADISDPDNIELTFIDNGGALRPNTDDREFIHLVNTEDYIYGSSSDGTLTIYNKLARTFKTENDFLTAGNILFKMDNVLAHSKSREVDGNDEVWFEIYDFKFLRQRHLDFKFNTPSGIAASATAADAYGSGYFFKLNDDSGYTVFRHDYDANATEGTDQAFTKTIPSSIVSKKYPAVPDGVLSLYTTNANGGLEKRPITRERPPVATLPDVEFDSVIMSGAVQQAAPGIRVVADRLRVSLHNTGSGLENKAVGYGTNSDTTTFYYVPNNTAVRISSPDGFYSVVVSADSTTTNVGRICLETDDYIWFVHSQYIGTAPTYTSASHRLGRIKKSDKTSEFFANFSTSTEEAVVGLETVGDNYIGVVSSNRVYAYTLEDGDRETEVDITLSAAISDSSLVYTGIAVDNDDNGKFTFTNHEGTSVSVTPPPPILTSEVDVYTLSSDRTRLYRGWTATSSESYYIPIAFFKNPSLPNDSLAGNNITASDSQGITFADSYAPVGPALNSKGILLASTAGVRRLNADNTITQLTTFTTALSHRFDKALETATDIYGYVESTTTLMRVNKSTGVVSHTNSSVSLPSATSQNRPIPTGALGMDVFGPGSLIGIIHTEGITIFNEDCSANDTYAKVIEYGSTVNQRYTVRRAGGGVFIDNSAGAFTYRDYDNNILITADQSIGTQGGADTLLYSRDGTQMLTHDGTNWFKWTITWT